MSVPQLINFFTPKTTSYFLYLPTYVLVNAHAKFFSQPPFLPSVYLPVWPDWAIFCSLGNFLKPLAPINLLKSPTFLGNYCKGVKIYHFSCELIFGQLLLTFANFYAGHTVRYPLNLGARFALLTCYSTLDFLLIILGTPLFSIICNNLKWLVGAVV